MHAEELLDAVGVVEELARGAGVHDAARVDHDDALGEPLDDLEVLLDEQDRDRAGRLRERVRHLADDPGREALGGLVDEEQAVGVEQGARERHHLLLTAREGARALGGALHEVREELRDELAPRVGVALGEPQVLRDREPGEHLPVLGHVPDAAPHDPVRALAVDALAGEQHLAPALDQAEHGLEGRRLADAVAAQHRGDARGRDGERHVLDDLLARDARGEPAHLEDGHVAPDRGLGGAPAAAAHAASPAVTPR